MENVIIFGLSSWFNKRKEMYYNRYNIVAVTDNNENKSVEYHNYIKPTDLKKNHYDKIIITSTFFVEIFCQLVNELEIDTDKIEVASELFRDTGRSHAQCSEDLIIAAMLKLLNIDIKDIFYLEIGANQPIKLSNTYYFYENGASGALVEANPKLIPWLKFVRPRDRVIHKAIVANRTDSVNFYISNYDTMSSTDYEAFQNEKKSGVYPEDMDVVEEVIVPAEHINDLFETIGRDIDIFSIDIEGSDYDVIRAIDFQKYRPKFIILEKRDLENEFCMYMQSAGYKFVLSTDINCIFIDK